MFARDFYDATSCHCKDSKFIPHRLVCIPFKLNMASNLIKVNSTFSFASPLLLIATPVMQRNYCVAILPLNSTGTCSSDFKCSLLTNSLIYSIIYNNYL